MKLLEEEDEELVFIDQWCGRWRFSDDDKKLFSFCTLIPTLVFFVLFEIASQSFFEISVEFFLLKWLFEKFMKQY